jgi:hypothetical protein
VAAQAAAGGKAGVVWASVRVLQASASVGKAEHMERLGHGKHERVEREAAAEAVGAAVKGKGRARRREGRGCNGHKKRLRMGRDSGAVVFWMRLRQADQWSRTALGRCQPTSRRQDAA